MIITKELKDSFRTHVDTLENATLISIFENATKFYNGLIDKANNQGISIDLIAYSLT